MDKLIVFTILIFFCVSAKWVCVTAECIQLTARTGQQQVQVTVHYTWAGEDSKFISCYKDQTLIGRCVALKSAECSVEAIQKGVYNMSSNDDLTIVTVTIPMFNVTYSGNYTFLNTNNGEAKTICLASDINECEPNPCKNGGKCTDAINDYKCACVAGYDGKSCEINVNECLPNPCQNGGKCTDGINDYTCACVAGYAGKSCATNINECEPNPCLNGGKCTDGINDFTCACVAGYQGKKCEININECDPNHCLNGGKCTDGINDYTCACVAGYNGKKCEINKTAPTAAASKGLTGGAIAGIVIGVIICIIIVICGLLFLWKKRMS